MATKKASKKVAAKKSSPKKKLDGKALADKRKPRDSVAQFIKDELNAGKSDVAKIVERAKAEFPKTNPTNGYVRFIARQIGKEKQVASEPKAKPAKAAAKKSAAPKKAAKKDKAPKADAPAEPKGEASEPAVDPAS